VVEPNVPHRHHDAIEFPDGSNVLVTLLTDGQRATVLQLPVVQGGQFAHFVGLRRSLALPLNKKKILLQRSDGEPKQAR